MSLLDGDLRIAATSRLDLTAVTIEDAAELFPIFSDPDGWWYHPAGRHQNLATTVRFCRWIAAQWDGDGLSYWTARDRSSHAVVGIGGARRQGATNWNLSYRLAADSQGRGFATEIGRAAQEAVARVDSSVPLIAWIDPPNTGSQRVAERLGLRDEGLRVDEADGRLRLAYSDRPLGPPSRSG